MKLKGTRWITGLIAACFALLCGIASGSSLEYNPDSFIHYATVDRPDGSFRQMLIDVTSAAQVEPDQPLPEGTTILMETWYGPDSPSTVFVKTKQEGQWLYGSFQPGRPDLSTEPRPSCHQCHRPFQETDSTLTFPLLIASLQTGQPQTATCDRPGRRPCSPEAYVPSHSPALSDL